MQAFKAGRRHNDIGAQMRSVASQLADDEIARRRAGLPAPRPAYTRGVLGKYARLVADASRGAVTDWDSGPV